MNILQEGLAPAGEGVYTVSTGSAYKAALQKKLYSNTTWQQQLQTIANTDKPLVLGIPSDCGGGILRGANWGPTFVRDILYQEYPLEKILDLGDVKVIPHLLLDDYLNQETIAKCQLALFKTNNQYPVSPLSLADSITEFIHQSYSDKKIFAIGGDHSVSYPLVKNYLLSKKKQSIQAGVIHFDAHTDLLEHRLGIPICFGSWTYHILPYLPEPNHLLQLGIRATKHPKAHWEKTLGLHQYWAKEINQYGVDWLLNQIQQWLTVTKIKQCYVTFDIDALDIQYASATGTPEANGLSLNTAIDIIKGIKKLTNITSADIVEVAPFSNPTQSPLEPEQTLRSACKISAELLSALN